jgi:apolipoprotein N-acyltransferase
MPAARVLERYAAASDPAARAEPDAIVWPESALPGDPLLDGELLGRLRGLSEAWDAVLVAGGPRTDWGPDWQERRFNSVFRIAGGEPVVTYDKREPVPFAETWPAWLPRPHWLAVDEIAPGGRAGWMRAGACEIGVLVCFEAERAALARELARGGADALVVVSNDAELPARAIAAEVAEARLRAVETGLPVLRVANAGATLAIDRYGRDVGRSPDGTALLRVAAPELALGVRWATPFLALCWVTVAVAVITAWRAGRPR